MNLKDRRQLNNEAQSNQFVEIMAVQPSEGINFESNYPPDISYAPLSDLLQYLKRSQNKLMSKVHGQGVVMVELQSYKESPIVLGVLRNNYLSSDVGESLVRLAKDNAEKFYVSSLEVRAIFGNTKYKDVDYEDFVAQIDATTYPAVARAFLDSLNKYPCDVISDYGTIDLMCDPNFPTELDCKNSYRITASFEGGISIIEKIASIRVIEAWCDIPNLLIKGANYKLAVDKPEYRKDILAAQVANRWLEIEVSVSNVSIFPKSNKLPQLALVNIIDTGVDVSVMYDQLRLNFR